MIVLLGGNRWRARDGLLRALGHSESGNNVEEKRLNRGGIKCIRVLIGLKILKSVTKLKACRERETEQVGARLLFS